MRIFFILKEIIQADSGVLKDEKIMLSYGKNGKEKHESRRIAYWDAGNK
jgi:hypothetical protein